MGCAAGSPAGGGPLGPCRAAGRLLSPVPTQQEGHGMRRRLAAGNWKMNGTAEGLSEVEALLQAHLSPRVEILLCPPATLLAQMNWKKGQHPLQLGAQDCHAEASGAHTGDLSAEMLKDVGAAYVIVGHSERRQNHAQTAEMVAPQA